jgi:thiol-disulfide isomerase/thioredoxin
MQQQQKATSITQRNDKKSKKRQVTTLTTLTYNTPTAATTQELVTTIEKKMKVHAVILVWADWCPHCISMKPAWEKTKKELRNSSTTFIELESQNIRKIQDDRPDFMDRLLNGEQLVYPTILIFKNNKGKRYTDSRDTHAMVKAFRPPTQPHAATAPNSTTKSKQNTVAAKKKTIIINVPTSAKNKEKVSKLKPHKG